MTAKRKHSESVFYLFQLFTQGMRKQLKTD